MNDEEEMTQSDNNRKFASIGGGVLAAFASICFVGVVATAYLTSWGPFEDDPNDACRLVCDKSIECGWSDRRLAGDKPNPLPMCVTDCIERAKERDGECVSEMLAHGTCMEGNSCSELERGLCDTERDTYADCISDHIMDGFREDLEDSWQENFGP